MNTIRNQKSPAIVMTLLVRDEADIVAANLEYHLSQGVTHIIATDNHSQDGTTEILREYENRGDLTYIRENTLNHDQAKWVTRMAHLAFRMFPNSIVFHVDTDEFWWPKSGDLSSALMQAFQDQTRIANVSRVNYLGPNLKPLQEPFFERCCYRQTHPTNALGNPLPGKICHRASANIQIDHGNHNAREADVASHQKQLNDIEVLHFPNRSIKQFTAKTQRGAKAVRNNTALSKSTCYTWRAMDAAIQAGRFGKDFAHQVLSPVKIIRLLNTGAITPCHKLAGYFHDHKLPVYGERMLAECS